MLPCFLGDADATLVRLTPVLSEARVDQWLLVHADLRHVPRIRIVMDALIDLFRAQRPAFEGDLETAPKRPNV